MIETKPFLPSQLASISGIGEVQDGADLTGTNGYKLYKTKMGTLSGMAYINYAARKGIDIRDAQGWTLAVAKTTHEPSHWYREAR